MKAFPMFIRTTGRTVLIVGGGEQAAQKARLLLRTDARLLLAAPRLSPELAALVAEGRAAHHAGPLTPALFAGAAFAFIASGCAALDAAAAALARAARCPVNVVDRPDLCDLTTPAIVDRSPLVVAIGSEGTAPVLVRQIRCAVETMLAPDLGDLAALAGRLRGAVERAVPRSGRRAFWRWVFQGPPRHFWERGDRRSAARLLEQAVETGRPVREEKGCISVVAAPAAARDLLTLRALARLQEADVILHAGKAGEEALELARRDAVRIRIGPAGGDAPFLARAATPVVRAALAEAGKGRRVVLLLEAAGGRHALAEAVGAAARAAGIAFEIVPAILPERSAAPAADHPEAA